MPNESTSRTGSVLLVLLRDPDNASGWSAFVARYGPKIYGWCRQWQLQEADTQNVTQNVLLRLVKKLRTFTYDPDKGTFRGWLKTLTHHAWSDYLESEAVIGPGGSAALEQLHSLEARTDLLQRLEEAFDLELFSEAQARVQRQVTPRDWEIYDALAVGQLSSAEAAEHFETTAAAVLMVKCRVKKRLIDELRCLEQGGDEPLQGQPCNPV